MNAHGTMDSSPIILLLDADPNFAAATHDHFEANGFEVAVCADGEKGVDLAVRLQPAAVVTDMLLETRSGFYVLKRLKALARTNRVIMIATFGSPAQRHLAESFGVDDFLAKPVSLNRLLESVRRLCSPAVRPPHARSVRSRAPDVSHQS